MIMTDRTSGEIPDKPAAQAEQGLQMEAKVMNDQIVCVITTADINETTPRAVPKVDGPPLAPDLSQALMDSFRRHEAAYRYLGR